MAKIISTINLKGGVGKSTTTVAMAEILAGEFKQRVLVIDLDPQTNATVMMIGETRWKRQNDKGCTLAQLFRDALEPEPGKRCFSLEESIIRNASSVREVTTVDLLPSSIDLIDVQDRLASMPTGQFYSNVPTDILRRATLPILDTYDYVLIDCPPNLGIITLNGLRISSGFIVPTIPDVLSTYGIPQIISRVANFSSNIAEEIEVMGIVITKYRAQSTLHKNTVEALRRRDIHVYKTIIPERQTLASSAEFTPLATLRQKYGYQGEFQSYLELTQEIAGKS